jgi:ABC-type glycerol-3-phosphate transport system substrate-binding protein
MADGAGRGQRRTVLRVWDWWSPATSEKYTAYFGAVKREFEALHPDVEIVYQYVPFEQYEQKMATALGGNSPPDVFQASVSWAEGFYARGMLLPLNGFMKRDRDERESRRMRGLPVDEGETIDRPAFVEAGWRHNTMPDGTVFGIPQILDAECLIWNLDLLRAAANTDEDVRAMYLLNLDGSVNYQRLKWDAIKDWESFRRITRHLTKRDRDGTLKQAGYAIYAHEGASPVFPWLAANGTNFEDDAGTHALFDGDAGVEAMQLVLDLYWKDRVSPPFRRQLSAEEEFNAGNVACFNGGTWSGKYITRNTEGRVHFDMTAFPPGPRGQGPSTVTWGNMLVISSKSAVPEIAWEYVRFVASLRGALRLLEHTEQNSPRLDFYKTPEWQRTCSKYPYLNNVLPIGASGKKRIHTQTNAITLYTQPYFESLLLRYPDIQAGRGPYPSVRDALRQAAAQVDRLYDRYNRQAAEWQSKRVNGTPIRGT